MRQRDFYILGLGLGGLLFSILTLIAGCREGTLDSYAIAAYTYEVNTNVVYQPANSTATDPYGNSPFAALLGDDIHWWFFTVHYLSLCGGYVGGTEDPDYIFLQCEHKAAGWKFRTDDPFIINFMSVEGVLPVNSTVPLETLSTAPAFGTLLVGIVFSVFSVGALATEAVGNWSKSGRLAQGSVLLLVGAAMLLTSSSVLVTSIIIQVERVNNDYGSWVQQFEAVTWSAVAFTYVTFFWKLSDLVYQKEKRRRLLNTGQL
ncbi:hypothetical protein N431DRAFT_432380 [Stipitochalara longipes BDJ]|nr:hypothetical protein N431DRAFT_432380 [Stipitochalara longipes BDJ]